MESHRTDRRKIGRREIGMIVLAIVLLIILTVKSTVLDEVKNLPPEEQQFKEFVDYSVARDYSGILEDAHLLAYRVYKIELADETQKAVLRYEDPETGEPLEVVQDGRYEADVRGYFLGVLPIRQFSVTAEVQK